MIRTQKGRDPHNLDGLFDSLVGVLIQETLRYRSDIRPMAGVDTLTQASVLSESDHPDMPFGFYMGKRPPRPQRTRRKGAHQRQICGTTETAKKRWRKSKQRVFVGLQKCFGGNGSVGRGKGGEDGWECRGSD